MTDGYDDSGYPHSGFDGWMGDDQPRPPGRGGPGDGKSSGGGDGGGGNPGGGPERPDEEPPLPPGDYDVTIQALATSDRQRVLVVNHEGVLCQTDQGNLLSLKARELLVERLKAALALDDGQRDRLLERLTRRWLEFFKLQQERLNAGPSRKSAAELLEEMPREVRDEAEEMLRDKGLVEKVIQDIQAQGVAGEDDLVMVLYLVGVSRLLPRPLSARIHGPSSSGKSYLIDKTAELFPPETTIAATTMTPQALYHMWPGELKNRWARGGERSRVENDEKAEATKALREMQASGKLSKLMPVKVGGEIRSVLIEQEGPIAFSESTTRNKVFDEDANRCVALHTDETKEQTERIIRSIAAGCAGNGTGNGAAAEAVSQRHWAPQRLLSPCEVVIPYADALAGLLRCEQVEMRRGVTQVFSTVRALALLHQYQRDRDPAGRLVATVEDYDVACRLLERPMARLLGEGVSRPSANFFRRLKDRFGNSPFTTTEAKRGEKSSKSSVHGWLRELCEAGSVEETAVGKGPQPSTWKIPAGGSEPTTGGGARVLPTAREVLDAWTQGGK